MTNLIATIIITVTTNWVTVSETRETVTPESAFYAVHRGVMFNQVGARVTNTVAVIEWKGKKKEVILESTQSWYDNNLRRSVSSFDIERK